MQDYKIKPYDRLQSIFKEKELTDKASERLDEILDEKTHKSVIKSIFKYFSTFFIKIDSLIFRKSTSNNNTYYKIK